MSSTSAVVRGAISGVALALLITAVVALALAAPIFTILAVNLLFGLSIPLTVTTWLATFWLHVVFATSKSRGKS